MPAQSLGNALPGLRRGLRVFRPNDRCPLEIDVQSLARYSMTLCDHVDLAGSGMDSKPQLA